MPNSYGPHIYLRLCDFRVFRALVFRPDRLFRLDRILRAPPSAALDPAFLADKYLLPNLLRSLRAASVIFPPVVFKNNRSGNIS